MSFVLQGSVGKGLPIYGDTGGFQTLASNNLCKEVTMFVSVFKNLSPPPGTFLVEPEESRGGRTTDGGGGTGTQGVLVASSHPATFLHFQFVLKTWKMDLLA